MEEELKQIVETLKNSDNRIKQYIAEDLSDFETLKDAEGYLKDVCEHGGG